MKNSNLLKIAILALVILVLVGGGFLLWHKQKDKPQVQTNYIDYQEPQMSPEEIQKVDAKIAELEGHLTKDSATFSKDDLYKLYLQLEMEYRLRGRFLEAKNILLQATKLAPEKGPGWAELYQVEKARTDYGSAENAIKTALDKVPSNQQYWREYLSFAKNQLKYNDGQMRELFAKAIEKTGADADISALYAQYLEGQGDLSGAIEQWKMAELANPAGKKLYEQEISRIRALISK